MSNNNQLFTAKNIILPLLGLLIVLSLWWTLVRIAKIPPYLLPAPEDVVIRLFKDANSFRHHFFLTALVSLIGLAAGFVFGWGTAIIFTRYKKLQIMFYPYFIALKSTPIVVIAPIIALWLGTDLKVRVLVVTVTSFFPLLVNGLKGLESVDKALLELAATYRANNWLVFTKLRIPASRPFMFAGLKVGAVLAVIAALVAEMLGADSGLGFLLMVSIYRIDTEALFCITILSVILSLFIFTGVVLCERKLFPWVTETDQTSTIS